MKKIFAIVTMLLLACSVQIHVDASSFIFTESTPIYESNWVYDTTGSLTAETIAYIDNLNETTLKDYQYAVYVVPTLNGTSMDQYKLDLFNSLGVGNKENNAGMLFVLAIDDREYGLEIGDGIQGTLRKKLSGNIINSEAMKSLKAGDWDTAIGEISERLNTLVSSIGAEKSELEVNTEALQTTSAKIAASINQFLNILLKISVVVFAAAILVRIIFLLTDYVKPLLTVKKVSIFLAGDEVIHYMNYYQLSEKSVTDFLMEQSGKLSIQSLYDYMVESLVNTTSDSIEYISGHFSLEDFRSCKRGTLDDILNEYIAKTHQIEEHNTKILLKLIASEDKSKIIGKTVDQVIFHNAEQRMLKYDLSWKNVQSTLSKGGIRNRLCRIYRELEVKTQLEKSTEMSPRYIDDVVEKIKDTPEYIHYISGKVPNSEKHGTAHEDKSDSWFWLMQSAIMIQNQIVMNNIHRTNNTHFGNHSSSYSGRTSGSNSDSGSDYSSNSSSNNDDDFSSGGSFGGGFGGGFSSGGGSSGNF